VNDQPVLTPPKALDLFVQAATLLFTNGQTTERTVQAVARLGTALGFAVQLFPTWDTLTVRLDEGNDTHTAVVAALPLGVDMARVSAVVALIDQVCACRLTPAAALAALEAVKRIPPVSTFRFAAMAGVGAAALGAIFGAAHIRSLALIGLSDGIGGWLRRELAKLGHNPLVQPFFAALLAGGIGAAANRFQLTTAQQLIALCPCMVLVPGPHLLNAAIDLMRARIALGIARLTYATLVIFAICAGLLTGLSVGGTVLPPSAALHTAPLAADMVAAGLAVAAYGTFFSMPWRMLPLPVVVGMLAHSLRWVLMTGFGAGAASGALIACLVVGAVVTPIAERLRLPFAGLAFASVVSLMPGVFLFRMAGGLVELAVHGSGAGPEMLAAVVTDGVTALMVVLAMTVGLIAPKMLIERFFPNESDAASIAGR
jgi:uncharacterized membrane protein YjjP (DUF1212 family)